MKDELLSSRSFRFGLFPSDWTLREMEQYIRAENAERAESLVRRRGLQGAEAERVREMCAETTEAAVKMLKKHFTPPDQRPSE